MADTLNKMQIIGFLGKDPELRYTQNKTAVCNGSIATNERYQKDGEWQEDTTWHNYVVWGKAAERFAERFKKGGYVYMEGKMQYRDWEDRDGNKRSTPEVNIFTFKNMDRRDDKNGSSSGGNRPPHPAEQETPTHTGAPPKQQQAPPQQQQSAPAPQSGAGEPPEDDIPF